MMLPRGTTIRTDGGQIVTLAKDFLGRGHTALDGCFEPGWREAGATMRDIYGALYRASVHGIGIVTLGEGAK